MSLARIVTMMLLLLTMAGPTIAGASAQDASTPIAAVPTEEPITGDAEITTPADDGTPVASDPTTAEPTATLESTDADPDLAASPEATQAETSAEPGTGTLIVYFVMDGQPLLTDQCATIWLDPDYMSDPCDNNGSAEEPLDGMITYQNVPEGELGFVTFQATGTPLTNAIDAPSTVTIVAGQTTELTIHFELATALGSVVVHVVDSEGNPVTVEGDDVCAEVSVSLSAPDVCDDADGTSDGIIHFADVPVGSVVVHLTSVPDGNNYSFAPEQTITVVADTATDVTFVISHYARVDAYLCFSETDGAPHSEINAFAESSADVSAASESEDCTAITDIYEASVLYSRNGSPFGSWLLYGSYNDDASGYSAPQYDVRSFVPGDYVFGFGATILPLPESNPYSVSGLELTLEPGGSYLLFIHVFVPAVQSEATPPPQPTVPSGMIANVGDYDIFAFDCGGAETSFVTEPALERESNGSFIPAGQVGETCKPTSATIKIDDSKPVTFDASMTLDELKGTQHTFTDVCSGASTVVVPLYAPFSRTIVIVFNPGVCASPDTPTPTPGTSSVTKLPNTGAGDESNSTLPLVAALALLLIGFAGFAVTRRRVR